MTMLIMNLNSSKLNSSKLNSRFYITSGTKKSL